MQDLWGDVRIEEGTNMIITTILVELKPIFCPRWTGTESWSNPAASN